MNELPPTCPDADADAWLRERIGAAVEFLLGEFGEDRLLAVLLTGSTARGEASVVSTARGFCLLGDLDLLVIVRTPFRWAEVRRRMRELSAAASEATDGRVAIDFGPAGVAYLENLRPSIFSYDLCAHGVVVWQGTAPAPTLPQFDPVLIPPIDGLRLLMNRMSELLPMTVSREGGRPSSYQLTKVALDLAGSALVAVGDHSPIYRDRPRLFAALLEGEPGLRAALSEPQALAARVENAAASKRSPVLGDVLPSAAEVERHARWCVEMWAWQARRLFAEGRDRAAIAELVEAYLAAEPLAERVRGWGKFLLHPLRPTKAPFSALCPARVISSSPQTRIYAMVVLGTAGHLGLFDSDWHSKLAELAPPGLAMAGERPWADEIFAMWQWLVRNN